jgi:hypothetical protein
MTAAAGFAYHDRLASCFASVDSERLGVDGDKAR